MYDVKCVMSSVVKSHDVSCGYYTGDEPRFDAFSVHELAYKGKIGSENLGLEFFKSSEVSGWHFENSKSSVSHFKN